MRAGACCCRPAGAAIAGPRKAAGRLGAHRTADLTLRQRQKTVEDKVAEMDIAGAAQWQALEAEIRQASARLHSAIHNASS